MKFLLTSILALGSFTGLAQAQSSVTPNVFGVVKESLPADSFNLLGVTVHRPVLATGNFETVNGNTLTDNDTDFSTILTGSDIYLLEITSGTAAGVIQELNSASIGSSNTELTTVDNLAALGLANEDSFQIRRADTIASIFGEDNSQGLAAGPSVAASDIVWIGTPTGFDRYHYLVSGTQTNGWRRILEGGGSEAVVGANIPVVYQDALYVQTRSGDTRELMFSGEVKTSTTTINIDEGFNYIGMSFPANSTLTNSNLQSQITGSASIAGADVVWIPSGGTFTKVYYFSSALGTDGWRSAETNQPVDPNLALPSALIIQRKAGSADITITPGF